MVNSRNQLVSAPHGEWRIGYLSEPYMGAIVDETVSLEDHRRG